jgi:hypothetical protein
MVVECFAGIGFYGRLVGIGFYCSWGGFKMVFHLKCSGPGKSWLIVFYWVVHEGWYVGGIFGVVWLWLVVFGESGYEVSAFLVFV